MAGGRTPATDSAPSSGCSGSRSSSIGLALNPQPTENPPLDNLTFPYVTFCSVMSRNTNPDHDPAELGGLQRDILSIVLRLGGATADQVRQELDRPLKDSTVRTVLRRLEEKGYLEHSIDNRTFRYHPAESRQRMAGRAVKRIVDSFCEGSVEALLVGMVDSKVLDHAELQRLAARIAEAELEDKGKKLSKSTREDK